LKKHKESEDIRKIKEEIANLKQGFNDKPSPKYPSSSYSGRGKTKGNRRDRSNIAYSDSSNENIEDSRLREAREEAERLRKELEKVRIQNASNDEENRMKEEINALKKKLVEQESSSETAVRMSNLARQKKELENRLKEGAEKLAESTMVSGDDGSPTAARIKVLSEQKKKLLEEEAKLKSISTLKTEKSNATSMLQKAQYGVDLCFIMDCTGSMSPWMKIVAAKIGDIMDAARKINSKAILRCAFVGYRDIEDGQLRYDVIDFKETDQVTELKAKLDSLNATGGGDEPEDIAGAYYQALKLSWKSSTRLVIHTADAPCHGSKYHSCGTDTHSRGDPDGRVPEDLLRQMCNQSIDFYFCRLNKTTDIMTNIFKEVYTSSNKPFDVIDIGSDTSKFLPTVIKSISASMSRSVMFI